MIPIPKRLQTGMPVSPDLSEKMHPILWTDWAAALPDREGRCQVSSLFEFLVYFWPEDDLHFLLILLVQKFA